MPGSFTYSRVANQQQLAQILDIQKRNIKTMLSAAEIESDGFVTVVHDIDILTDMNRICPHVIASFDQQVIGYALAMHPVFRDKIPILRTLFRLADELINNRNYLVMGQICIDKPYRGQGVFRGLYNYYREQLGNEFDCLLTEVAVENQRSMQAHKTIGFEKLISRTDQHKDWELLVWDWSQKS